MTNSGQEKPEKSVDIAPKREKIDVAMEKIASQNPAKLMEMWSLQMSQGGNPLHHKMNEEHISQVLNLATRHDEREFELTKQAQENTKSNTDMDRWLFAGIFLVVITLVVFVLHTFKNSPEILIPIMTGIGGLVTGFLGGWGFGKTK